MTILEDSKGRQTTMSNDQAGKAMRMFAGSYKIVSVKAKSLSAKGKAVLNEIKEEIKYQKEDTKE
jgi:gas vesicle protein